MPLNITLKSYKHCNVGVIYNKVGRHEPQSNHSQRTPTNQTPRQGRMEPVVDKIHSAHTTSMNPKTAHKKRSSKTKPHTQGTQSKTGPNARGGYAHEADTTSEYVTRRQGNNAPIKESRTANVIGDHGGSVGEWPNSFG